jgi:hypothetical protein
MRFDYGLIILRRSSLTRNEDLQRQQVRDKERRIAHATELMSQGNTMILFVTRMHTTVLPGVAYAEDEGEFWIACDSCSNWLSASCENLAEKPKSETYTCKHCIALLIV